MIRGYYINLDRSPDRRAKMDQQIEALGLADTYSRFPAVDGRTATRRASNSRLSDGEIAIFKSHYNAIESAKGSGAYTHILEDDAILSPWVKPYLAYAEKLGLLSLYDLIFLEFGFRPDLFSYRFLIEASGRAFAKPDPHRSPSDFSLVDIRSHYAMGMASYVVNFASIPKLLSLLQAEWIAGPRVAIDVVLRQLMETGQIRAGGVLPFLTSVGLDETIDTESGRRDNATLMAVTTISRQSFYIERELDHLREITDRLDPPRFPTEHHALLYKLAGFFHW